MQTAQDHDSLTDEQLIEELERNGVRVVARDVPTGAAVRLGERDRR